MVEKNLSYEIETALNSEILGVQNLKTRIEKDILEAIQFISELKPQT